MTYIYMISAVTENTIRVLQRMAGIFARYRLNVEQLNVFATGVGQTSYFNIALRSDEKTIKRVIHQLQKMIELFEVKINNRMPLSNSVNPLNEVLS